MDRHIFRSYVCSYRHVLDKGFSQAIVLPSSQSHDSVLCTCVADLNWDGVNELVLGTFGRVRLDSFIINCDVHLLSLFSKCWSTSSMKFKVQT